MPHRTTGPDTKTHTSDEVRTSAESAGVLFVLLSRALLMFAMDYERKSSRVSLAVGANVLRVLGDTGIVVRDLRRSLDDVAGDSSATSPLMRGTEPPAGGWRNKVHRIETLPHFPMVLHRGGFPDGS